MFGNGAGMPNMNMQGMMFNNPNFNMMPNIMNQGGNFGNNNMMQYYMAMMMNGNNMNGMNMGGNEDWMKGYNLAMSEENTNTSNNNQSSGNKINVIFKTTQSVLTNILIDYGKTMSELIKLYLRRMGKPELFGRNDGVCFLFNATKISFDCQTKVEDFFQFTFHPTIIVNDVNNLIGA